MWRAMVMGVSSDFVPGLGQQSAGPRSNGGQSGDAFPLFIRLHNSIQERQDIIEYAVVHIGCLGQFLVDRPLISQDGQAGVDDLDTDVLFADLQQLLTELRADAGVDSESSRRSPWRSRRCRA